MSRATRWILVGCGLLAIAAFFGFGALTQGAEGGFVLVAVFGLAGLFAVQVGVVALAVKIGTHELLHAVRGPQRPAVKPPSEPMDRLGDV